MPTQLPDYSAMAAQLSIPKRRLQWWVSRKIVPCLRIGHKTTLFEPDKVIEALRRYEIKAVRK
jgi:hypothetical protein